MSSDPPRDPLQDPISIKFMVMETIKEELELEEIATPEAVMNQ